MLNLLVFLLPVTIYALTCSTYKCHGPGYDYGNVCYTEHEGNAFMQICRETGLTYCDVDFGTTAPSNCTAPPVVQVPPQNPGASCTGNSQCLSNNCTSAVCQGNATNAACTKHSDCAVGNFCGSANTCQLQVAAGGQCYVDYQCVNSCGCDLPMFSPPGKCVPYYSIAVKSQVQYCVAESSEAYSRLCVTGVCTLNVANENGLGTCSDTAANINYNEPCNSDTDCVALISTTNQTVTGDCQCGYGASGNAYCNAFSGDAPSVAAQTLYKQHLSNTTALNTCHTLDRFSDDCTSKTLNSTDYASLVRNVMLSEDLPAYLDNDYCTQLIINDDFFEETLSDLSCPSWSCSNLNNTECLVYEEGSNSVYLNTCGSGLQMYGFVGLNSSYCDTGSFSSNMYANVSCEAPPATSGLYPGSACVTNSSCLSANCTGGVCQGAAQNGACNTTNDCNLGLRCNALKVCSSLLNEGASGCFNDYDCSLSSGCNLAKGSPGFCTPYLSLKSGDAVTCASTNGFSNLCESGACFVTNQLTNVGTCTSAPKLSSTFPKICTSNTDCVGKNSDGKTFTSACKCGYNYFGHSYCEAFPGDAPWEIFLSIYKKITQTNSVTTCHSSNRYSGDCMDALAGTMNLNTKDAPSVLYYNATSYSDFLLNDACVKATVNNYYWSEHPIPTPDPDDSDDDDDFASKLAASGLLAVILAY